MKRIIQITIILAITLIAVYLTAQPVVEPIEPIEVEPIIESIDLIEKKPVLVKSQYEFDHTGRYYHRVKMPDGSIQEIKSLKPLTPKQWEERVAKAYVKPIEPEPTCEECHDGCGRQL